MTKKSKLRFKKLSAAQRKAVWRRSSNWTEVIGSNTYNKGGQSPIRSVSSDPRHPIKDDTTR